MAWETYSKSRRGGGGALRPNDWNVRPMVRIGKTTIAFSPGFIDLYAHGKLTGVFLLFDEERRIIGFKVPSADQLEDPNAGWYGAGQQKKKGKNGQPTGNGIYLSGCPRLLKRVRDCIGNYYYATMNPEGRVIEVRLHPDNVVPVRGE